MLVDALPGSTREVGDLAVGADEPRLAELHGVHDGQSTKRQLATFVTNRVTFTEGMPRVKA